MRGMAGLYILDNCQAISAAKIIKSTGALFYISLNHRGFAGFFKIPDLYVYKIQPGVRFQAFIIAAVPRSFVQSLCFLPADKAPDHPAIFVIDFDFDIGILVQAVLYPDNFPSGRAYYVICNIT